MSSPQETCHQCFEKTQHHHEMLKHLSHHITLKNTAIIECKVCKKLFDTISDAITHTLQCPISSHLIPTENGKQLKTVHRCQTCRKIVNPQTHSCQSTFPENSQITYKDLSIPPLIYNQLTEYLELFTRLSQFQKLEAWLGTDFHRQTRTWLNNHCNI